MSAKDLSAMVPFLFVITVVPGIISALIGRAKGRSWYWFALFGLLSVVGLAIAFWMPPATEKSVVAEPTPARPQPPNAVHLTWREMPVNATPIGEVEVSVRSPAARTSGREDVRPALFLASDALRRRAVEFGADGVVGVQYFRKKPPFWTFKPEHVLTARGMAVSLGDASREDLPDAEAMGQLADMGDLVKSLGSSLMLRGIGSICWAAFNSLMMYNEVAGHRGASFILPPAVIYAVSGWLLIEGVLMFRIRSAVMLIVNGLTLVAIAIVNFLGHELAFLGIFQIIWGAQEIDFGVKIGRQICEYKRRRSALEDQRQGGISDQQPVTGGQPIEG